MTTDRFPGPLAAAWPDATTPGLPDLLVPAQRALPVPPAGDRGVWDPDTGSADRTTRADLLARAQADLGSPWPVPTARAFARYFRDGDRVGYEHEVGERQRRLSRAAVVAASTLDPRWLDEVADGVTLLCEQSTWCWPAHDDTFRRHGAVVPTVTDPYLDLGAGEVVGQLAWLDALLGTQLDEGYPGLRARIRHEADVRVIDPFLRRRDWHWLGLDGDVHNWNPWIHGNVLLAALRLVEDPARRALVVALVVEGIDRYVASLPQDGAIDEGYAYWWNGACRALEALDVLAHATDGRLVASGLPSLRATVAFPHRMHLGGDWYLNLADGQARPPSDQPWHALHRAALAAGDDDARRHAVAHRVPGEPVANEREGLGRLLRALTDTAWSAAAPSRSPLPRDVWLPSTQVLLARQAGGTTDGLTLAVKGGHNDEHHNHNDVGSVMVALHGVPVVVDVGRPTYTAQTFGPDRYRIWTMQSTWHNVPTVRGSAQPHGRALAADAVAAEVRDGHAQLRADLAGAYGRTDVRHWWRTARLDRSRGRVTVVDEWHLDDADGADGVPSDVHLVLAGDVSVHDDHVLVAPVAGAGTVAIRWSPSTVHVSTEVRELDDPMLGDIWGDRLHRLVLSVGDAPVGTLTVTVEEGR